MYEQRKKNGSTKYDEDIFTAYFYTFQYWDNK